MKRLSVLLAAVALAACTPELDWRELKSAEGGYKIMLPAKPDRFVRDISLGGTTLRVHMLNASAEELAFGASHAALPEGANAKALIAAARDGLLHNIKAAGHEEKAVKASDYAGLEIRAVGQAQGRPTVLAARILAGRGKLYQVVFVGSARRAGEVDVEFYLRSFDTLR